MKPKNTIRPVCVETDVPAITDIIIESNAEQTTEYEVRRWLQTSAPGRVAVHLVCTDEQNAVIGYGHAIHTASSPANHFFAWVGVNPPNRCQGVGSAVWDAILDEMQAQNAAQLVCDIAENAAEGMRFAEKRGFTIDRHQFHSTLDLTTFDETPFLPVIAGLEAQGMRFCALADFPDDAETQRKYYELNLATVRDIPGEYWDFAGYPQFFKEHIIGAAWFKRENQLLAVDGHTFAGFASLSLSAEIQSAYNATTGVLREYRGRKIGLALKVLAALFARQHGALRVVTDNDSLNAPILAINRKMGYQPESGKYMLIRRLL